MRRRAINLKPGDCIVGAGVVQQIRVFYTPVARPGANCPTEEPDRPVTLEVTETWTTQQVDNALADCYSQRPNSVHAEGFNFVRRYRAEDMVELYPRSKKRRKIA